MQTFDILNMSYDLLIATGTRFVFTNLNYRHFTRKKNKQYDFLGTMISNFQVQ